MRDRTESKDKLAVQDGPDATPESVAVSDANAEGEKEEEAWKPYEEHRYAHMFSVRSFLSPSFL